MHDAPTYDTLEARGAEIWTTGRHPRIVAVAVGADAEANARVMAQATALGAQLSLVSARFEEIFQDLDTSASDPGYRAAMESMIAATQDLLRRSLPIDGVFVRDNAAPQHLHTVEGNKANGMIVPAAAFGTTGIVAHS